MGTTAGGLPYPEPTDPIAQGADAIKALANAVEGTWQPITPATDWAAGVAAPQIKREGDVIRTRGTMRRLNTAITSASAPMFTIPAGMRPPVNENLLSVKTAGTTAIARVVSEAGGTFRYAAGNPGIAVNEEQSLAGLSWSILP